MAHAPPLRQPAPVSRAVSCSAEGRAAPEREQEPGRLEERGRGRLGQQELEAAAGSAEEAPHTLRERQRLLRRKGVACTPQPAAAEGAAPSETIGGGLVGEERAAHGLVPVPELVGRRGVEHFQHLLDQQQRIDDRSERNGHPHDCYQQERQERQKQRQTQLAM